MKDATWDKWEWVDSLVDRESKQSWSDDHDHGLNCHLHHPHWVELCSQERPICLAREQGHPQP